MQDALIGSLRAFARHRPLHVDVYSLNEHADHGDQPLAADAHRALQDHGIATRWLRYRDQGPLAMARSIGGCDAFISARLHGALVAYLYGVPFAIVDYHRKCRDFADDIELPQARRITVQHQDAAAFSEAFGAMLAGPAPLLSRDVYARKARAIFQCAPWARPLPA
jgi:polysaccharide pyruvyl transferase WcaK-like protein